MASSNTVLGAFALGYNATILGLKSESYSNIISIGVESSPFLDSGSNDIIIGDSIDLGAGGLDENPASAGQNVSGRIVIGNNDYHKATYIAGISGATVPGGSAVYVSSNGQLGTGISSSARFKMDIAPMGDSSDVLLSFKPVTFKYKPEYDPHGVPQWGLVAEDVDKVCPDLVLRDAGGKIQGVRYEQVNAMLLNEFLKEHKHVKEQGKQLEEQARQLAAAESTIAAQGKRLATLATAQTTIVDQQTMIKSLITRLNELDGKVRQINDQLSESKPQPVKTTMEQ